MTRGQPAELVDQHGRKYPTADERQRFLAAVRAHRRRHADLSTTAIYCTAVGVQARELVTRVWR